MKTCHTCKVTKPLDQFQKVRQNKDGLNGRCIPCIREYRSEWQKKNRHRTRCYEYGLTPAEYQEMWDSQNGLCAICQDVPPTNIDHDHQTGLVRGLLCGLCNRMLGQAKDDPARLFAGAEYLTTPRS